MIENLNEIDADVIFIKNIDNVVPDRLKPETVEWKQVIAGVLVSLQKQAFEYLRLLDAGATDAQLEEIAKFVSEKLCTDAKDKKADAAYLREKLNRPMRVCGVVKNVGEPGGGPFDSGEFTDRYEQRGLYEDVHSGHSLQPSGSGMCRKGLSG